MGEFAVIGLGRFGRSLALSLSQYGQSVMAIDSREEVVKSVSSEVDNAVQADTSDEETLAELGLERMTCVVVAIGADSMEASILTTALLRQRGVTRIVARALNPLHSRVLLAVGANEIINPEGEMGERLARQLSAPNLLAQVGLEGEGSMAELDVPRAFVAQTLLETQVRDLYDVSVIAIRRRERVIVNPKAHERLEGDDRLIVFGRKDSIRKLSALV
jgi:trk system potassium uptake protein TrkA